MTKLTDKKKLLVVSILLFLSVVTLWGVRHLFSNEVTIHRKMTVKVNTPGGLRVGSSVIKIRAKAYNKFERFASGNAAGIDVQGEAVTINLGNGKYLFALNGRHSAPFYHLKKVWGITESSAKDFARYLRQIRKEGGIRSVTREFYPLFVTFDNWTIPETVKVVDPNELNETFGPGYEIESILMEITSEPVTQGRVELALNWISVANFIIPPEKQPLFLKDQSKEQKLLPSDFVDWHSDPVENILE